MKMLYSKIAFFAIVMLINMGAYGMNNKKQHSQAKIMSLNIKNNQDFVLKTIDSIKEEYWSEFTNTNDKKDQDLKFLLKKNLLQEVTKNCVKTNLIELKEDFKETVKPYVFYTLLIETKLYSTINNDTNFDFNNVKKISNEILLKTDVETSDAEKVWFELSANILDDICNITLEEKDAEVADNE